MRILEGRWQDWVVGDKLGELIAGTEDAMGFDAIFVDTFAEGYEGEWGGLRPPGAASGRSHS